MNVRIGMLIAATALASSVAPADDSMHAEFGIVPMRFSGAGASLTPDVGIVLTSSATLKGTFVQGVPDRSNAQSAITSCRGARPQSS